MMRTPGMTMIRRLVAVVLLVACSITTTAAAHALPQRRPHPYAHLQFRVFPVYQGYPITVDGETALTNAKGVATFSFHKSHQVSLDDVSVAPKTFTMNGVQQRVQPADIELGRRKRVLLDVYYAVTFTFASHHGAIDASAISRVTVKGGTGAQVDVPVRQDSWLQGRRAVLSNGKASMRVVNWTVQSVLYAGSNVVNASQQRFSPSRRQKVPVDLLFFPARLQVHDAIFGRRPSGELDVVYPDGYRLTLAVHDGRVRLPNLPRGNYTVVVRAGGPALTQPVAISSTQELDLRYYTWLDVAVIGGALAGVLFGLLAVGWSRRRRKRPSVVTEEIPAITRSPAMEGALG